eukprot:COSAG02_NODE_296_length_25401_cov_7.672437_18_plen_86_part_00
MLAAAGETTALQKAANTYTLGTYGSLQESCALPVLDFDRKKACELLENTDAGEEVVRADPRLSVYMRVASVSYQQTALVNADCLD